METNLISTTVATGLSFVVAAERSGTAPTWKPQGAAVSFAGMAAYAHARTTDLPVLSPRGAPV